MRGSLPAVAWITNVLYNPHTMIAERAVSMAALSLAILSTACASSGGLTPEQLADRLEMKTGVRRARL